MLWIYRQTLTLFTLLLLAPGAFAQSGSSTLVDITKEALSRSNSSFSAKKEIQEKLILEVGQELVIQMIGPKEYKTKKNRVDRMILSNYGRFIPYIKADSIRKLGTGYSQKIKFQVSLSSLRDVLSREGLLYERVKDVRILPLVSFLDSFAAKSFKWWYSAEPQNGSLLWRVSNNFQGMLEKKMWQNGFYLINPIADRSELYLAPNFKTESHRKADLIAFGQSMKADLVIHGGVRVGASDQNSRVSKVKINLKATLVNNRREIAEVEHSYNTSPGDYQSQVLLSYSKNLEMALDQLSQQVLDAYEKGKFGTQSMRLTLKAPLKYNELQQLKQKIRLSNYQIKSLTERKMSAGEFSFEMDVSGDKKLLVDHFKVWQPDDIWAIQVKEVDEDTIELGVRRK